MIDTSWVRGPEPPKKKKETQRTKGRVICILLILICCYYNVHIYSYIPNRIVILLKEKITSITEMVLLPLEARQQSQQILCDSVEGKDYKHNGNGIAAP